MKTTLIAKNTIPTFDSDIRARLEMKDSSQLAVSRERMRIGVRNEGGNIYRAIGITGLDNFLKAIETFQELGFTDELEHQDGTRDGYDAIFRR